MAARETGEVLNPLPAATVLRGAERTKANLWARLAKEWAGLKRPPWAALAARMTLILKSSLRNRAGAGTFAVGGGDRERLKVESEVVLAWLPAREPVTRNNFSGPMSGLGIVRDHSTKIGRGFTCTRDQSQ